MINEENGGPAFPTENGRQVGSDAYMYEGVTLRDYFASKAMQGFAADPNYGAEISEMALWSYKWADAMLNERAK